MSNSTETVMQFTDEHANKRFQAHTFLYCADWLYAACLEYAIFFSIDSPESRKQYDEYCLSIMQTITYAHERTHFQGTGCIFPFDLREWN